MTHAYVQNLTRFKEELARTDSIRHTRLHNHILHSFNHQSAKSQPIQPHHSSLYIQNQDTIRNQFKFINIMITDTELNKQKTIKAISIFLIKSYLNSISKFNCNSGIWSVLIHNEVKCPFVQLQGSNSYNESMTN